MRLVMVFSLALAVLTGCPVSGNNCKVDRECNSGEVCARVGTCLDPSEVREVKAIWTINGGPANAATCNDRDLFISFSSTEPIDSLSFSPVPCFAGQFGIDKLPLYFDTVELGVEGGVRDFSSFDASGNAQLDLPL